MALLLWLLLPSFFLLPWENSGENFPGGNFSGDHSWRFGRVIDGDTFTVFFPGLPEEVAELAVRVRGVDAPERGSKAQCPEERFDSERARDFTRSFLQSGRIELSHFGWDKYGGRLLAEVRVDKRPLAAALIAADLAAPYTGGHKNPWCGHTSLLCKRFLEGNKSLPRL